MPTYSGIWSLSQQFQGRGQGVWPAPPGAPTIGTASVTGTGAASVTFTAPTCTGVPAGITGYIAKSTPGCFTVTGSSSPIAFSGLCSSTAYTFAVAAQNASGYGAYSAQSNSVTPAVVAGQQAYTTAGTYTWVAPAGVTSVSAVAVGGGGGGGWNPGGATNAGGGGGLGYRNNISVGPGNSYTVVVGAGGVGGTGGAKSGSDSYFIGTCIVRGGGASASNPGSYTGGGGGSGGVAGRGGGGAGGYSGAGGNGGANFYGSAGNAGAGGGGGGGGNSGYQTDGSSYDYYLSGAGGGGVGILGQGSNGAAGASGYAGGGGGGSGGANGSSAAGTTSSGGAGGAYGGGGGVGYFYYVLFCGCLYCGGSSGGSGGVGAVRIIWPGNTRQFPSTCTGNL